MAISLRIRQGRNQPGPTLLRKLYGEQLAQAGSARQATLDQAQSQLDQIGKLLPGAMQAGLSIAEIARLTSVSRPTLYELLKASNSEADPRLAVLASVVAAPQTALDLHTALGIPAKSVASAIGVLRARGWIEVLRPSKAGTSPAYASTKTGEEVLSGWDFSAEFDEGTTKTLRVMLELMRFTPEERIMVEKKVARARAEGKERLGVLEAMRMGIESELSALQAKRKSSAGRAT